MVYTEIVSKASGEIVMKSTDHKQFNKLMEFLVGPKWEKNFDRLKSGVEVSGSFSDIFIIKKAG